MTVRTVILLCIMDAQATADLLPNNASKENDSKDIFQRTQLEIGYVSRGLQFTPDDTVQAPAIDSALYGARVGTRITAKLDDCLCRRAVALAGVGVQGGEGDIALFEAYAGLQLELPLVSWDDDDYSLIAVSRTAIAGTSFVVGFSEADTGIEKPGGSDLFVEFGAGAMLQSRSFSLSVTGGFGSLGQDSVGPLFEVTIGIR